MLFLSGLWLGMMACGSDAPADCKSLSEVSDRDACRMTRLELLREEHPRSALELARGLEQAQARDATLLAIMTSSRAFSDAEVRRICNQELASPASQDQCTSWLNRPHLRTTTEVATEAEESEALGEDHTECGTTSESARDDCYHRAALKGGAGSPDQALAALSRIQDPQRRGQAVAGVLRNFEKPSSLEQLQALEPLLKLAAGRWKAESTSLLGSHLPFQLLRECDRRRLESCDTSTILGFSIATCEKATRLEKQCFSHICSGLVERTMLQVASATPSEWAEALGNQARTSEALDARLTRRSCQPIWAGRKLIQHGGADTHWAAQRCRALQGDADACLSGVAEEYLVHWLRRENVTNPALFYEWAMDTTQGPFEDVSSDLKPLLPCGAFHVLNQELNSGLSGSQAGDILLRRLQSASPRCVWKDEKRLNSR